MIRRASVLTAFACALLFPLASHAQKPVYVVQVSGVIELGLAPYVERSIDDAVAAGASAVVLELETPGGRVDAAQRIVKAITSSPIPIYAFVNTHAWSAGAMIALAADSIYMVPGSSIGAATPVLGDGKKGSEKIVSALRGEFRALAERRGLDPRLAEAMVDEEIEVEGVIAAGKLLTLTAGEAVDLGFAASEVDNLEDLLSRHGLDVAAIQNTSPNWAEQLVRFLSHPIVAPILLSLGTLGIFVELKTPSFGVAGIIGLSAFAAFFGSHLLIGLAGWEEVILLGVGLVALGVEAFVIPGFGIAGVVAILCIGAAVFMSLLGSLPTWPDFARASAILAGATMLVVVGAYSLIRMLPNTSHGRSILLSTATGRDTGYVSAPERDDLIGLVGTATTDLHPAGIAVVGDERLDVVTEGGFIAKGTAVRVMRSEGYRHIVSAVEDVAQA